MKTTLNYNKANAWIIEENEFDHSNLGKCEAIMCLGNGYLGIRSSTEESYTGETRGYYIAGTFNKLDQYEVSELPNIADIINIELELNENSFSLEKGKIKEYSKSLNLKTGELHRHVLWESMQGELFLLDFYRTVSLKDMHLVAQKIVIVPVNCDAKIKITSGINGRMTNSGSQHMTDGEKRFYDRKYMQLVQATSESGIDIIHNTTLSFKLNQKETELASNIAIDRRRIFCAYDAVVPKNNSLTIEKISNVYTSRDLQNQGVPLKTIQERSLEALKASAMAGYDQIASVSATEWEDRVWETNPIIIDSEDGHEQLAVRFAQYHLTVMTPIHDKRMGIGAKGLSGEGYKGHTFWDTEIFILPYFIFTEPEIAKNLLIYRYLTLEGAHKKANSYNYKGAQFPWESAWLDDGEVTPVWGPVDIVTGLPTKIWSGFIEQHVTADIAYAVWQYYMITDDQEFMDCYGYELIFDTAKFWSSRLEYSQEDKLYHINDVVGPDEYKEHVDDNAFTNYLAYWNIKKAIEYYGQLQEERTRFEDLFTKLDLNNTYTEWIDRIDKVYLPTPGKQDFIIAQDKSYLTLKDIDLTKYKRQKQVGTIFKDYNLEQVNNIQVSKQADVMILFFLMEDLFSHDVKKANWNYYEPRTLHDSSLSLSTHCVLANDMCDYELAYELFKRACAIDLGANMKSSNEGIHSASMGGIWQSVIYGFGGVRMMNGQLRIEPKLPGSWNSLEFSIRWKGQSLQVFVNKQKLLIKNCTATKKVEVYINNKAYSIDTELEMKL